MRAEDEGTEDKGFTVAVTPLQPLAARLASEDNGSHSPGHDEVSCAGVSGHKLMLERSRGEM